MLTSLPFRRFIQKLSHNVLPRSRRTGLRRAHSFQLAPHAAIVETLEDRALLSANIVVNSTVDAQHYASSVTAAQLNPALTSVTIRDAINAANNTVGDINITFDASVFPSGTVSTIDLQGTPLVITNTTGQVTIQGAASAASSNQLVFDGNSLSAVFQVAAGASAEIDNVTITGGRASIGAGIENSGTLTLRNDTITGNEANVSLILNEGGGIANHGTLNIVDSTIAFNDASGATVDAGGGIFTDAGVVTIIDSTIADNTSASGGGIAASGITTVKLSGSILAANTVSAVDSTASDFAGTSANVDATSSYDIIGAGNGTGLVNGTNHLTVGTVASPVNAGLSVLGNFGGSTQTVALLPGSIAVGAGTAFNDTNSVAITTDQRGIARVSGSIDIGAFESANPTVSSITRVTPTIGVTSASSVTFAVAFDMPVLNVSVDDFSVNAGAVSSVTAVNSTTYNVTVNGLGGFTGTLVLGFAAGQNITDSQGLALAVTTPTGVNVNTYIIDHSPPASVSFDGEYAVTTAGSSTVSLASITQAGASLTLSGSTTVSATVVSNALLTLTAGTATYADDKITFSADSPFAGQVWTKLSLAADYTDAHGAATHVVQSGASVTLINEAGVSSSAVWSTPTQLLVNGTTVVTVGNGKLTFADGTIWYENISLSGNVNGSGSVTLTAVPSQIVVTDYTNNSGASVHLVQNGGSRVVFIDMFGGMSMGTFFSATQATADAYPGDIATISGNTIVWTDGTVWTRSAVSNQVTVFDYVNQNGVGTHAVENGTTRLVFADGLGRLSLGTFINANQATADLYPNDIATFTATGVFWQDGYTWIRSATPSLLVTANVNGSISHFQVVNSTTLLGLDGSLAAVVGTRLNGKIYLSNGDVWNNFDFDGLNAFFQMAVGVS